MAAEKQFETKVKQYLQNQGCWYVKYWGGGQFTKAGVPDLLVCCNGYFLAIELKASTGRPSQLQLYNIRKIRDAGGFGIILYPSNFHILQDMIRDLKADTDIDFWKKHQTFFDNRSDEK